MSQPQSTPRIPTGFWGQIDHQLHRIHTERPETFDGVRAILLDLAYDDIVVEVHRNEPRPFDADSAFFAGSGGDATLRRALYEAGWFSVASEAMYYYVMESQTNGELLTYIEGDVVRGRRMG